MARSLASVSLLKLATVFSDLELFSILFAAAIHDLAHTGQSNQFHINTKSNLALLYNDQSVLENHHISTAFRIMKTGGNSLAIMHKSTYF